MVLHSAAVITVLPCDIQPGALRQRYSIEWRVLQRNNTFCVINNITFNLTLSINSSYSVNGSQYQCEVTIHHDGERVSMTYEGSVITLITIEGMHN